MAGGGDNNEENHGDDGNRGYGGDASRRHGQLAVGGTGAQVGRSSAFRTQLRFGEEHDWRFDDVECDKQLDGVVRSWSALPPLTSSQIRTNLCW